MEASLKFDLSDPGQRVDHLKAVHAAEAFICIHDILEVFRRKEKDSHTGMIPISDARELIYNQIPIEIQSLINT